jgi:hypothetical protein
VRRTNFKDFFALQKGALGMAGIPDTRRRPARWPTGQKKGPLDDERPKSREETPKVGYDTSQMCRSTAYGLIRGAVQWGLQTCRKFQQACGSIATTWSFALALRISTPISAAFSLYSKDVLNSKSMRPGQVL